MTATAAGTPLDRVLEQLHGVTRNGDGFLARCPVHEADGNGHRPSLSVKRSDGRILLHCFGGCTTDQVLAALSLEARDLFTDNEPVNGRKPGAARIVATYPYHDEDGALAYEQVRLEPKDFRARRPDGAGGWTWNLKGVRRVLFGLPDLIDHTDVYLVEGEKDALALRALGLAATTTAGGAKAWAKGDYAQQLRQAGCLRLVILPDADAPGREYARQAAGSCAEAGIAVKVLELPGLGEHGDVSDWLEAGHTAAELADLVATARAWTREAETSAPEPEATPRAALEFFTLRELAARVAAAGPRRWTFRGLWPAGDYGVHAAEMKAQKTWNTTEAAVSRASGTPLFDRFTVDEPGPVLMFAGEGGEGNILRRIRAVAEARRISDPDGLPIVVCSRVPHLGAPAHLDIVREQLRAIRPVLVTLDPLYLAARGASLADLYAMGALLETVQHLCADVGASLWLTTHNNRKQGNGAARITGAGPAEWGRVLLTAEVKARHTDPTTRATSVVTVLTAIGGEIPDLALRIHRRVWADDPDDLDSPLHVETTVTDAETDQAEETSNRKLTPAAAKLLEAAQTLGSASSSGLVDWIKNRYGHGLRRETVSRVLADLERRGLMDSVEAGKSKLWKACVTCDVTRDVTV